MLPDPGAHRAVSRRQVLTLDVPGAARAETRLEADYWIRVQRPAMACRFEVLLSGEDARHVDAAREALDAVEALEAQLTVFRETSEVARLNQRAGREHVAVEAGLFALLQRCRELSEHSAGAFDITSTPLSRCWGFLRREGRLPSELEIEAACAVVGMQHVELDAERRALRFAREGVELNFGAIGKGYALDRMAALLRARGVEKALLSAGRSSVLALGTSGEGFLVDVVSPRAKAPLARLRLRNAALGTSGAGVQFATIDGRRYGHVIDPRSGRPASGVLSASVIAKDAATADALSTAFLIGGKGLAERYCSAHPDVLALVTPDDGCERPLVAGGHPGARLEAA
jgi:thiamine biosynthesis lipoprotein